MFFIIAGVSPKTKVLDDTPRTCPVCGLAQARLKRIDHYLSVFFIPVLRVKKGEPVLICDHCDAAAAPEAHPGKLPAPAVCANCGRRLHPDFRYCPFCGKPI